jgi:hypothetical protein
MTPIRIYRRSVSCLRNKHLALPASQTETHTGSLQVTEYSAQCPSRQAFKALGGRLRNLSPKHVATAYTRVSPILPTHKTTTSYITAPALYAPKLRSREITKLAGPPYPTPASSEEANTKLDLGHGFTYPDGDRLHVLFPCVVGKCSKDEKLKKAHWVFFVVNPARR